LVTEPLLTVAVAAMVTFAGVKTALLTGFVMLTVGEGKPVAGVERRCRETVLRRARK
jgi:hypothetical protein